MAPQLSPNDRERIVTLKLNGHKIADIHRLTGITRHTIYFWLKRWEECGDITAHRRQIYKRATTDNQDADIIAAHMADPNLSPKATSSKYKISVDTVRRRLKEAKSGKAPQGGDYITPLVSIEDGPKREKLAHGIHTSLARVNSEFIRVTSMMSTEVIPSTLSALKRLEKVLTAIETPLQARSFAIIQSRKRKKKPKPAVSRKDLNLLKALKEQGGQPGSSGAKPTQNAENGVKLKRQAGARKIRNFRNVKEVPPPPVSIPFTENFFAKYHHLAANSAQNLAQNYNPPMHPLCNNN